MLKIIDLYANFVLKNNNIKRTISQGIISNSRRMDHHMAQNYGQCSSSSQVRPSEDEDDDSSPRLKKHPPHLRGKEIGLFYAKQHSKFSKPKTVKKHERRRAKDAASAPISLDLKKEQKIYDLFENIGDQDYAENSKKGYNFNSEYQNHLQDCALREKGLSTENQKDYCLVKDCEVDMRLFKDFKMKQNTPKYKAMLSFRSRLPAFKMKQELIDVIEKNQVLVVMGETGCGKTTQVPQFILDSYIETLKGSTCKIVCTQPRRISAITVAERVANERSSSCGNGDDVGYQIRLESEMPRQYGSILFCTTGIILQQLQSNENLAGISHIIVDEVHERNLDSDFLLISLKDIIKKRKDLKVILMSATLNAEEFSAYFDNCPMIKIPGYTFPVDVYMLEDMIDRIGYVPMFPQKAPPQIKMKKKKKKQEKAQRQERKMEYLRSISDRYSSRTLEVLSDWNDDVIDLNLIVAMLRHITTFGKEGAILIFLPGWAEISKLNNMLNDDNFFRSGRFLIMGLHSLLPTINQKAVFDRPPPGTRKIIIATNIAETSITIDDVVYVIDAGKIKMKNFDHIANVQSLLPEFVALSNMKQRQGRAGRTQPGICYHMFTRFKEMELEAFQKPEMLRTSLEETILKIKILKLGKAGPYLQQAMNPPDPGTVLLSLKNLRRINAINAEENLTPLGYHLARLPMDPHTGRMILLGAIFSCLDPILSIAASLDFKDAFVVPLGQESTVDRLKKEISRGSQSDHILFANAIMEWEEAESRYRGQEYCRKNFLSISTLRMLVNLKKQYAQYLKGLHFIADDNPKRRDYNINSHNILLLKAIICAGLYPNVAKVRSPKKPPKRFFRGKSCLMIRTEDGNRAQLHPKSVNSTEFQIKSGWLAYHLKVKSTSVFLHDSTAVTPYSLLFFGGILEINQLKGGTKKCVNNVDAVSIDNWIDFQCDKRKAELVMNLRKELDNLLEYKITNPGVTNWNPDSREAKVLNCIIELITIEDALGTEDAEDCEFDDEQMCEEQVEEQ